MARVLLTVEFDAEGATAEHLNQVMDDVTEAVEKVGTSPSFGLEVDGDHRDPDDPGTGLWS